MLGMYDHMNKHDGVTVSSSIEDIARQIEHMNYGTHRLLSALVRARRESAAKAFPNDPELQQKRAALADEIEKLLNKGLF